MIRSNKIIRSMFLFISLIGILFSFLVPFFSQGVDRNLNQVSESVSVINNKAATITVAEEAKSSFSVDLSYIVTDYPATPPDYPDNAVFVTYSLWNTSTNEYIARNIVDRDVKVDGTKNLVSFNGLVYNTEYTFQVKVHGNDDLIPDTVKDYTFTTSNRAHISSTIDFVQPSDPFEASVSISIKYTIIKNGDSIYKIDFMLREKDGDQISNGWKQINSPDIVSDSETQRVEQAVIPYTLIPSTSYEIRLRINTDEEEDESNEIITPWAEFRTLFRAPKVEGTELLGINRDNFTFKFNLDTFNSDAILIENIISIDYKALNTSDGETCIDIADSTCGTVGTVFIMSNDGELQDTENIGRIGGQEGESITSNNDYDIYFKVNYDLSTLEPGEVWENQWDLEFKFEASTRIGSIQFEEPESHVITPSENEIDFTLNILDDGGIDGYKLRYQYWEITDEQANDPNYDPFLVANIPQNLSWLIQEGPNGEPIPYTSNPEGEARDPISFIIDNLRPNKSIAIKITARGFQWDGVTWSENIFSNSDEVRLVSKTIGSPSSNFILPRAEVDAKLSERKNNILDISLNIEDPSNSVDLQESKLKIIGTSGVEDIKIEIDIANLTYDWSISLENLDVNANNSYLFFEIAYLDSSGNQNFLTPDRITDSGTDIPILRDMLIFEQRQKWELPLIIVGSIIAGILFILLVWYVIYYIRIGRYKKKFRTRKPGSLSFI